MNIDIRQNRHNTSREVKEMVINRVSVIITLLFSLLLILPGCSKQENVPNDLTKEVSKSDKTTQTEAKSNETNKNDRQKEFTTEELAQYDGSRGKPAYIALNGTVYDVSKAKGWRKGIHTTWTIRRMAGRDLTTFWEKAPASHKKAGFLDGIPVVGKLKNGK